MIPKIKNLQSHPSFWIDQFSFKIVPKKPNVIKNFKYHFRISLISRSKLPDLYNFIDKDGFILSVV